MSAPPQKQVVSHRSVTPEAAGRDVEHRKTDSAAAQSAEAERGAKEADGALLPLCKIVFSALDVTPEPSPSPHVLTHKKGQTVEMNL